MLNYRDAPAEKLNRICAEGNCNHLTPNHSGHQRRPQQGAA